MWFQYYHHSYLLLLSVWATVMFASLAITGERWWGGFSCGRATYVAGIWLGQLKMISFELFTIVFFNKYLGLALAGLSFELIVLSKLASGLFTFISTAVTGDMCHVICDQ